MAVKSFISALPGPEVKYELNLAKPKSLDEAILIALNREVHFGPEVPFTASSHGQIPPQNVTTFSQPPLMRKPGCKHCGGNHPAFVCKPCRHCGGPHYDNKCPASSQSQSTGNAQPIPQNSARQ